MSDVRLFYMDDSGAQTSQLVVYGWVELSVSDWRPALRSWLDWRKALHASAGLPASYELHATKFVNGRGRPTGTGWDRSKANRSAVVVDALSAIAAMPGVRTGAVCRDTTGTRYVDAKAGLYADLVAYAAYQCVLRAPGKELMWDWYPELLGRVCAVGGKPQVM